MSKTVKLILRKPITVMSTTYSELNFSEPTGIVIAECGTPIKSSSGDVGDPKKVKGRVDSESVHNLMIACAGVPREVIDMLCPADWMAGMAMIMGFFGDMAPETES